MKDYSYTTSFACTAAILGGVVVGAISQRPVFGLFAAVPLYGAGAVIGVPLDAANKLERFNLTEQDDND